MGIEAADFTLPTGVVSFKFDVDYKRILFVVKGIVLSELAEQLAKPLEALGWKREALNETSSECHVRTRYSKNNTEIEVRLRLEPTTKTASAMITGDGLLWTKPVIAFPLRISYETWLQRNGKTVSLETLNEYSEEMRMIPVVNRGTR